MRINNINNDIKNNVKIESKTVKNILKKLLEVNDIEASSLINNEEKQSYPYIHFGMDDFETIGILEEELLDYNYRITVTYNSHNPINDEIDDPENNKFIDIHHMDPYAIIKGPIKYKMLKDIYEYLDGPGHFTYKDDYVFFCFDNKLINKLKL